MNRRSERDHNRAVSERIRSWLEVTTYLWIFLHWVMAEEYVLVGKEFNTIFAA